MKKENERKKYANAVAGHCFQIPTYNNAIYSN